jgi:hypothetical protein
MLLCQQMQSLLLLLLPPIVMRRCSSMRYRHLVAHDPKSARFVLSVDSLDGVGLSLSLSNSLERTKNQSNSINQHTVTTSTDTWRNNKRLGGVHIWQTRVQHIHFCTSLLLTLSVMCWILSVTVPGLADMSPCWRTPFHSRLEK